MQSLEYSCRGQLHLRLGIKSLTLDEAVNSFFFYSNDLTKLVACISNKFNTLVFSFNIKSVSVLSLIGYDLDR